MFLVFDVIKLIIMGIYLIDNTAYACTYGIRKKTRIVNLILETILIGVIVAMTIIQVVDTAIRFKELYLRLLDLVLIFRKLLVAHMLFAQNDLKEEFLKLDIGKMNPDERIISILKFIESNHKGIFKYMVADLRYCVKMVSTGQLNDVELLNKEISEQMRKRHSEVNQNLKVMWAESITNAERTSITKNQIRMPIRENSNRRMSLMPASGPSDVLKIFPSINEMAVQQLLNLDEMTVSHLRIIETVDFNIFKIKEYTNDNEMVVVISHLMAKEKLFDTLPIINEKFLDFIKKVQSGYLDITYHNKTHATDLA